MRDGAEEINIRLTKLLSNWFAGQTGRLPDRIILYIVITRDSILSQGGVTVWMDSGESETVVN
jgi:hypothetical protein